MRIGIFINPIAGIGGPAGWKGSDDHWKEALAAGHEPLAGRRAAMLIEQVLEMDVGHEWRTVRGSMGVAGIPTIDVDTPEIGATTRDDTLRVARALAAAPIDLLLFVGGDGTAYDMVEAVGTDVPVLGIPGGTKITSATFAYTIPEAAELLANLEAGFDTVLRDVTDLDEEDYRQGDVDIVLKGNLRVPLSPLVQGGKCPVPQEAPIEPLVEDVLQNWPGSATTLVLVGAGSVMQAVKQRFWGAPTLLGIDAVVGDKIVAQDLSGDRLDAIMDQYDEVHFVVSTIGGQGMVLGRGTQQLRPRHLRKIGWDRIHIVAPNEKLIGVHQLRFDTGDAELDRTVPKFVRVTVGYNERRLMRTTAAQS